MAAVAANAVRMERRDHATREGVPDVMIVPAGRSETAWSQRMKISLLDRIRASIRCKRDDLAVAAGRAKSAWRRRDLGPSLKAPIDFRAGTARIAHARHAASDYDERAMRAIVNPPRGR